MQRLNNKTWRNIFRNLEEDGQEVEISWLDPGNAGPGEWALHWDCELFEDGFPTEQAAAQRLEQLQQTIL